MQIKNADRALSATGTSLYEVGERQSVPVSKCMIYQIIFLK